MATLQQNVSQNQCLPFYAQIKKINELSLAIETIVDSVPQDPIEPLPNFVLEGILVGIQHLAQRINQLTQANLKVELVQGGEGL